MGSLGCNLNNAGCNRHSDGPAAWGYVQHESLNEVAAALRALAREHAATPMPARSNLQQAVPKTFGCKK